MHRQRDQRAAAPRYPSPPPTLPWMPTLMYPTTTTGRRRNRVKRPWESVVHPTLTSLHLKGQRMTRMKIARVTVAATRTTTRKTCSGSWKRSRRSGPRSGRVLSGKRCMIKRLINGMGGCRQQEQEKREQQAVTANPLLKLDGTDFSVKRRWDDDVIFRYVGFFARASHSFSGCVGIKQGERSKRRKRGLLMICCDQTFIGMSFKYCTRVFDQSSRKFMSKYSK